MDVSRIALILASAIDIFDGPLAFDCHEDIPYFAVRYDGVHSPFNSFCICLGIHNFFNCPDLLRVKDELFSHF